MSETCRHWKSFSTNNPSSQQIRNKIPMGGTILITSTDSQSCLCTLGMTFAWFFCAPCAISIHVLPARNFRAWIRVRTYEG